MRQTIGPTSEERELTAGRDNLFSFYFVLYLFIYFLGCSTWHVGSWPPDQESNPCSLHSGREVPGEIM